MFPECLDPGTTPDFDAALTIPYCFVCAPVVRSTSAGAKM